DLQGEYYRRHTGHSAPRREASMSWSWLGRFWRAIKLIYLFLLPARFGILAVAILGWAFLMSDQGADILRALVEYDPAKGLRPHYLRMLGFVLTTNACALQIWY